MQINKILKTKFEFPKEVVKKISKENKEKIEQKLAEMHLKNPSAGQIYQALINKVQEAEEELCSYLGRVDCGFAEGMQVLVDEALRLFPPKPGFFLKESKARQMLIVNPPLCLIKILGYRDIDELLSQEDFYEIYGSLRFVETPEWMNRLIDSYKDLKKDDFEQRAIRVKVFKKKKWHDLAEHFIKKKYHNLTHLKELGAIFAMPRTVSNEVGVILTSFSLLLHYFNEVSIFAEIFSRLRKDEFPKNLISLLKGEIKDPQQVEASSISGRPDLSGESWRIIPRYLAKDEKSDSRIFEPHINPEAIFWHKADQNLNVLAQELPGTGLEFFKDLNWVGDYFPSLNDKKRLITFNSADISISFANQLPLGKRYLYHYREALWNKVFSEIIEGDEQMEKWMMRKMSK